MLFICSKSRYEVGAAVDADLYSGKYAFPPDSNSVYAFVGGGRDGRNFYPAVLASHERLSVGERDYATTLQMRQTATPTPPLGAGCSHSPAVGGPLHHVQALWTCPVHGHVVRVLTGPPLPPLPPQRIYDVTTRLEPLDEGDAAGFGGEEGRAGGGGGVGGAGAAGSPFYHELDPSAVESGRMVLRPSAAGTGGVGGNVLPSNGEVSNCAAAAEACCDGSKFNDSTHQ